MNSMFFDKQKLFGLLAVLTLVGCAADTNTNLNPDDGSTGSTFMDADTGDYTEEAQFSFVTGHVSSVDGILLSDAQIAIADDSMQIIAVTTSDQDGMYSLILDNVGNYELLAYWQDGDVGAVEQFIVSDESSYIVDLVLDETPPSSEEDDGVAPPPGACYPVYDRGNTYCSWHTLYMARYWSGAWWCYWAYGGWSWVPVGSC